MQSIWARYCAEGERFLLFEASLSENVLKKTSKDGMFGLSRVPKEILSSVFNLFNLETCT